MNGYAERSRSNGLLVALGIMLSVLAGCGGRAANPVAAYQPGDEGRSCEGLKSEVAANEQEIAQLLPDEDATGKNVALGVAGAFLLVPWFFMDFKEGEAIEIQALRRRNQRLREIAADKGCTLPPPTVVFQDKPTAEDDGQSAGQPGAN